MAQETVTRNPWRKSAAKGWRQEFVAQGWCLEAKGIGIRLGTGVESKSPFFFKYEFLFHKVYAAIANSVSL